MQSQAGDCDLSKQVMCFNVIPVGPCVKYSDIINHGNNTVCKWVYLALGKLQKRMVIYAEIDHRWVDLGGSNHLESVVVRLVLLWTLGILCTALYLLPKPSTRASSKEWAREISAAALDTETLAD